MNAKPKAGSELAGFGVQSILVTSQSEENMLLTPSSVSTLS
ncbi:Membrane spanning protein [Bacillus cereus R309803]|nr:Membrane spanning protein [Bacillus cereus R309803]